MVDANFSQDKLPKISCYEANVTCCQTKSIQLPWTGADFWGRDDDDDDDDDDDYYYFQNYCH